MKKLVCALLMLGLAFALVGCGDPPPSPHEQINELLDQVEHYLTRSNERFQRRDQLTEELRDNFDEVLETRRIAFNTTAIMDRNNAYELAEEAIQIANEHGIDIIEIVRRRVTPGIMELFE